MELHHHLDFEKVEIMSNSQLTTSKCRFALRIDRVLNELWAIVAYKDFLLIFQ
jgi:hypothetical protein